MLLAEDSDGHRIAAAPGNKATCPMCKTTVISKCGQIKIWHWAHQSTRDCDAWYEPESDWHYAWKEFAGLENTEKTIVDDHGTKHRADIKFDNMVVELQHSQLPVSEVQAREEFYGQMIWILDGSTIGKFSFERWKSTTGRIYYKLRGIKKKWILAITKPLFFHFDILHVERTQWWNDQEFYHGPDGEEGKKETFTDVLIEWQNHKFARIFTRDEFCGYTVKNTRLGTC
jgi:hypothetical protein